MKTKILIILIILVGLSTGGFFVWKNISAPEVEEKEEVVVKAPSIEVKIYKGIWLPTLSVQDPNHLASNIQKLKDTGVNTIFIQAFPPNTERWLEKANFPPELIKKIEEVIPIEKELLIATIQTAHINGLKVGLTMTNPMCVPSKEVPQLEEIDLEALNSKIIEYAKLAEKYEVEFFAPLGEPDNMFGPSASATWGQEILPKIREVYHGKVIWRGGGPMNLSGYDYIGFTISAEPDMTLEEFSQRVDKYLDAVLGFAERDKVMITEIWLEEPRWSEEEVARAYEIVFEKGKDRVIGFFAGDFLEVELPGMPLVKEEIKTEEVIRRWYKEILP